MALREVTGWLSLVRPVKGRPRTTLPDMRVGRYTTGRAHGHDPTHLCRVNEEHRSGAVAAHQQV